MRGFYEAGLRVPKPFGACSESIVGGFGHSGEAAAVIIRFVESLQR